MDILHGVLVLAALAHSQDIVPTTQLGYCDNINVADLGNTVNLTRDGLIAGSISPVNDSSSERPMVKILDFKFVCEVAGYIRNTIGAVSIVVKFECLGRDCLEVESPTSVTLTEQFTYSCNPSNVAMPPPPGTISGTITARSINTSANLNTSLSVRCGECTTTSRGDDVTHCRACSPNGTLCGGQGRCLATTQTGGSCCSYYLNDVCVTACPTGLTGDSKTYDCGCDQLAPGNVGTIIAYSNRTKVGSVATHFCNQTIGYELPGTTRTRERTCSQDVPGWSGNNIVCQLHSCDVADVPRPDSGTVSYSSISFGSVATFNCDTGYRLSLGDAKRVCEFYGWSGTNPTCDRTTIPTTPTKPPQSSIGSMTLILVVVFSSIGVLGGLTLGVILIVFGCYKHNLNHRSKSHFYSSGQVTPNRCLPPLPPPSKVGQPEPVPIYEDMTEINNSVNEISSSVNVAYGITADPDHYYY